ncbi:extracellular solute-binding protein [Arthrobacter tecti]
MPMFEDHRLSRRSLLAAGGMGALALAASPLLTACTPGSTGAGSGAAGSAALPTYVPFTGLTPDLPGDPAKGINPAFLKYPTDRVRTVEGEVGTGGEFSAFVVSFSPPPPPYAGNSYWKEINSALNIDFKPTLVPQEFQAKLATMLSSGDIPDLVTMYLGEAQAVRRFEDVAKSQFADLSEHLSGDAIEEYPNLARLAPDAWKSTYVDGRIYSTPTLRIPTSAVLYQRADLLEEAGANPNPTSGKEFEEMCAALTNPEKNRWAIAGETASSLSLVIYPMFGVPLGWGLNDGKLVKDLETPQWEEAIAFTAKLWKNGYFHPNSGASSGADVDGLFQNGTVALMQDSFVRYAVRADSEFTPSIMKPFSANGGEVISHEGSVMDLLTFVKKGSPERVKESLRVLNYLSAPFGSEEHFLLTYGVGGTDHTLTEGQPLLTDVGSSEVKSLCLRFIAGGPDVLHASNGNTAMVERMHAHQTEVSPLRVTNPTSGIYSAAASTSGAINQKVADTVNDVIVGRQPIGALKDAVKAWKSGGGDKMRADYEKGIEEQGKSA